MPEGRPDPKELGFYISLGQVGLEMVVPVVIGLVLEHYFPHWTPWGIVTGAVLGLIGGLAHLVMILNQHDKSGGSGSQQGNR